MLGLARLMAVTRLTWLPWQRRRPEQTIQTIQNERLLETGGVRLLESGGYRKLEKQP